ncbi:tellurite resistance TerB family protein [Litchfieldella rifensis]|uniref:Tellurite resistance TerB family protein n=1 Tax=Litchfieldella rifensis TaxID=762643 RepID=A0ABV7LMS2_9GAMM
MNAKGILDQLMKQAGGGSDGNRQGGGGFDVDRLMKGLSSQVGGQGQAGGSGVDMKSLLGGGALGMLIGSKRGRKMGGKALKYGAIAGVGVLAWKAWQNYQSGQGDDAREGQPLERLQGQQQEQRSLEILQAMIMAARADGHIDENERAQLTEQIDAMGADEELHAWVEQQFQAPLDAEALAKQADSPQAAREIYLVSVAMIDDQNPMERAWLDQLGAALGLDAGMTAELERQAMSASG